jgi:hypothetical protein
VSRLDHGKQLSAGAHHLRGGALERLAVHRQQL